MNKSVIFISVVSVAFLALAALSRNYSYFPFDLSFTRLIQQLDLDWFRSAMIFLSRVGEPEVFIPLVVALSVLMGIKSKKNGLFLLLSFGGAVILTQVSKLLVHRIRPDARLINQFLPELKADSFPSGHVMFYLSTLGFLIFLTSLYIKDKFWNRLVVLILVSGIILIGLSRVYLGEHWLSDVLGSYLLGSAWLALVVYFWKKV